MKCKIGICDSCTPKDFYSKYESEIAERTTALQNETGTDSWNVYKLPDYWLIMEDVRRKLLKDYGQPVVDMGDIGEFYDNPFFMCEDCFNIFYNEATDAFEAFREEQQDD